MKTHTYIKHALVLLILACGTNAESQNISDELRVLLAGKTTLTDIMAVVDDYYLEENELDGIEYESDYLKWKRWEWFMSSHLGSGGEFVDISHRLLSARNRVDQQFPQENRNINSSWIFAGPSSSPLGNANALYNGLGRVDRIAFHPTDVNTIFLGTPAGGLWKTTNHGTSWTNLTDHLPSLGISGIVISHANTNTIYLLTGDGDSNTGNGLVEEFGYMRESVGVLKSTDGGISWVLTGTFPGTVDQFVGYRLVQSPTDADVLLATTSDGLYRTNNGGASWSQVRTGKHYDVVFKPGSSTKVYATDPGDFIYSDDGGVTWETDATFDVALCGTGRVEIAVAPSNSPKVYLVAGPTGTGSFCGLYLSTDSGGSFTRQSSTPNVLGSADTGSDSDDQSNYDLAIAVRDNSSTNILVAGLTVWRSTNGGSAWTNSTSYNENGSFPYIHPDVHDLAYNPLNHNAYCATDGGFYRSTDFGVTWTSLTDNIETTQFYHMRVWNNSTVKMMGGCQDNGVKYRPSSTSAWEHIMQADGFDVVFNPLSGEPGYCTLNGTTVKFSNDGANHTFINPAGNFFKTLAVHNTRPDTVLCGGANLWRSYNGGSNWTNEGNSGSWALSSCPSNNTRFYAAGGSSYQTGSETNSGLYFSSNNGDTWTTKSGNTGFPSTWTKITDVSVKPTHSGHVWATFGGFTAGQKVYRSTDTGDNWTNMTANLPNVPVYCIALDALDGAYVGTDIGVFYRSSSMTNWMPWSNGLPNAPVTDIAVQSTYVRVSTFGRGAWYANRADGCTDAVTVGGNLSGDRHYEANVSVTSTGNVVAGEGNFVSFQSGDYIDLKTGFDVENDSEFLGFISPCGQGGIPSIWQPGSEATASRQSGDNGEEIDNDIKHAFPLGSIDNINYSGNTATVSMTVRAEGVIEFTVIGPGKEPLVIYSQSHNTGMADITLELDDIDAGFSHVIMYNDKRVAHFQDLAR